MLNALTDAIIARLSADLPTLGTCAAYPKLEQSVALPAVLVECAELTPDDQGSATLDLTARFVAYCIYDPVAVDCEKQVRDLALTVAIRVFQEENFGQAVSGSRIVRIGEDDFKPELDGYRVWAVEWTHDLTVGEPVWQGVPVTGAVPTVTLGSFKVYTADHSMADGLLEPAASDRIDLEGS